MLFRLAGVAVACTFGIAAIASPVAMEAQDEERARSRAMLIARSKVWRPTDIPSMNLKAGPQGAGAFAPGETVTCDYVDKELTGASPKFACRLSDGDELKVKYGGGTNGEVYGEVAASRLLWALGFSADRMYPVRVICRGCPDSVGGIRRDNGDRIVDPAAIERKLGRELAETWDWEELEQTDESLGGATRAERDALTLLAVFLQHSDSKAKNQRIVCLDESEDDRQPCAEPMMMINDVGISFGRAIPSNQQPRASVNLAEWAQLPIWKEGPGCIGNLSGSLSGTLKDPVISEAGREFLAKRFIQLSDDQLRDLFEAARVTLRPRAPASGRSGFPTTDEWVNAFTQKRAQIVERQCAA
jgi:hypothetical protein